MYVIQPVIHPVSVTQLSTQVNPIGEDQRDEVIQLTHHFITRSERLFQTSLQYLPVSFDLKGRCAGMYRIKNGVKLIRFNPWIFSLHYQQNLYDTVPHEVAHYVVETLFGTRGIKPHGEEWRNVMISLGREPKTTCDFSIEGVPTRQLRHFAYRCQCRTHRVSSIRHNRILRGQVYCCKYCGAELKPITLNSSTLPEVNVHSSKQKMAE